MVFSEELSHDDIKIGQGIVIPCKNKVITSSELIEEAEHLWAAERSDGKLKHIISADWGRLGLFVNPKKANLNDILEDWRQRVKKEVNYGNLSCATNENKVINDNGLFTIPWPSPISGEELLLHFILATATKPTLERGRYPDSGEIARAWICLSKYSSYFWNNRKWGIETFQDIEIERWLRRL